MEELISKAKMGDAEAQYLLGLAYRKGTGSNHSIDREKAFYWWELSASNGCSKALVALGEWFEFGDDHLKIDAKKSLEYFLKASESGDADALINIGQLYANGIGLPKDMNLFKHWALKAAELGHPYAIIRLWEEFRMGSEEALQKAFQQLLEKEPEDYNGMINFRIARCYEIGHATAPNEQKSLSYYLKAASMGHPSAMYNIGNAYRLGRNGVQQNFAKAIAYYRQASMKGHASSQNNYGYMLEHGHGVERSSIQAFEWYQKAAQQGHRIAQYNCGQAYLYGQWGAPRDERLAVTYYTNAAMQEHPGANYKLGICYTNGSGVEENPFEAFKCFQRAASLGSTDAKFTLAQCYEFGIGIPKDLYTARKLYKEALTQGQPSAAEALARTEEELKATEKKRKL